MDLNSHGGVFEKISWTAEDPNLRFWKNYLDLRAHDLQKNIMDLKSHDWGSEKTFLEPQKPLFGKKKIPE